MHICKRTTRVNSKKEEETCISCKERKDSILIWGNKEKEKNKKGEKEKKREREQGGKSWFFDCQDCFDCQMIVNDCQWLSMIVNDCQWLPMIASDCQ